MSTGFFHVPKAYNESVLSYRPGSPERETLVNELDKMRASKVDIPMFIGGEEIKTENKISINPPHDHKHVLGYYHFGDKSHVELAVKSALNVREDWANMSWEHRASIFLKAADLLAGPYRAKINAATMLGQSKNPYQAEIDSACEMIDFLRFNVEFMSQIYSEQPESAHGIWNRLEYRALEGFVFAITPFNFTSIAGNLPSAPALMGNVVVWKPALPQIYSAHVLMDVFREAGVPDGVINLIFVDGPDAGDVIFSNPDFAGLHFTGSTKVFKQLWKIIGNNIDTYKAYPRIVGETGGKDFVLAHKTANAKQVSTALARGAFEYQGQKCSAVSRAYLPDNLWPEIKKYLLADIREMKMGGVEDFSNFINAVIDERAFKKITKYIDEAKTGKMVEVIAGGEYDDSKGYFIQPTVIVTQDPDYVTMHEEIFGPVLTIYVYRAERFEEAIYLVDQTSPYGLTGAIFAEDRYAIELSAKKLRHAAGNFYINDKPTGAVVGQQPFGGSRGSGTNDKAGSKLNLLRWVTPRNIKENFNSPKDSWYPFMG